MGAPSWIFAGFEFSPDKGLRRQGRSIELSPKAQGLLELLLRAPGALVTKAAIAEALWPRGAASDESIARVGFVLRRTLEDAAS